MADRYTVAVASDMHGNAAAFDAVLADLMGQPHDALVIAGDLVLNGPRPAESLARIRAQNAPTIYGNTDRFFLAEHPSVNDPGVRWVREWIGADGVDYLASLAFEHRVTPPDGKGPGDDLLIVHATPTNVDATLVTQAPPAGASNLTITPEEDAAALIGGARAELILYGHIHHASAGTVRGQRVASIGASGFPFDGDQRAAYAFVHWDGAHWQVEHRRVAYDVAAVIAELERSDAPFKQLSIARLHTASAAPPLT